MKKLVLASVGLLLLAAIAFLGAAFHFSRNAEKAAAEWSQKLEESAPFLKVSDNEYRRGLFSSTQRLTIAFPGGKGAAESITFMNVIKHGPFPGFAGLGVASIEHSWEFDEATQKEVTKAFGAAPPFAATTTIAIDGTGVTELRGAPAAYSSGDGTLTWQGLTGTVRFSKGLESYTGEFSAPLFSATGKNGGATVKGVTARFDQRRMPGFDDLYLGSMVLSVEAVSFKDAAAEGRVEKLIVDADASSADNQFMDAKVGARAARVVTADVDVADVDYAFSMRHLHAPSLAQWTKAMKAAGPKQAGAKPDTAALMAQMEAMQSAMKIHGVALLKYEPVIAIDRINLKTKDGEMKMSGTVRLPGVTDADMQQPFNLIGKVDAAATIAIPEAFARNQFAQSKVRAAKTQLGDLSEAQATEIAATAGSEFAQMLATFGQQGYFVSEGGLLKSKIAFKGGALMINDKPFNPMGAAPPAMPPPALPRR